MIHNICFRKLLPAWLLFLPLFGISQQVKVLTNHIGYESGAAKKAIVLCEQKQAFTEFQLVNDATSKAVHSGKLLFNGPVNKWRNWLFWSIDFSSYNTPGSYRLIVKHNGQAISSYPFVIEKNLLERNTISDLVYYFKGQRSSGLLDEADHHLALAGKTVDTIDAHGGWYDATGDYGKHLSHLSFSSYFNPQQITITAWSLLKSYSLLVKKSGTDYRQYNRRLLDEAMYGADYLARIQVPGGSFYRSVSAPGPGKLAKDRVIGKESAGYTIKKSKDQSFGGYTDDNNWKTNQVSFRSGGGLAIAALAMAAQLDTTGSYSNGVYLKAAENAFRFLGDSSIVMTNDGRENIVDDYCALMAATELFKVTRKQAYQSYAEKRAEQLIARLQSWKAYKNFWRADDVDRPFFHPSDAGLPVISLLEFYPVASAALQQQIKLAVKKSLDFELSITNEVSNPFGYSRQLTQDTAGVRKATFFFPHGSDAAPWWQGENARLGSMAAAARMAVSIFKEDRPYAQKLEQFAGDQLNWILGLNPFDACMLQGKGRNNPQYGFFGTFEYTNAPGGIVNGITSGLEDENNIDLNLQYVQTGKDYDWRWAEQWLPHAAWYLVAVALGNEESR